MWLHLTMFRDPLFSFALHTSCLPKNRKVLISCSQMKPSDSVSAIFKEGTMSKIVSDRPIQIGIDAQEDGKNLFQLAFFPPPQEPGCSCRMFQGQKPTLNTSEDKDNLGSTTFKLQKSFKFLLCPYRSECVSKNSVENASTDIFPVSSAVQPHILQPG